MSIDILRNVFIKKINKFLNIVISLEEHHVDIGNINRSTETTRGKRNRQSRVWGPRKEVSNNANLDNNFRH